tara:strand:- start:8799 stop:9473 length:675 start_codon:yes stop_codon:yes gene_type:complete
MVNIDTVYQKVLAFANKEQRGYITPKEFNLFAEQAQMEIFEQYFYDLNQHARAPGNSREYSDIIHNINEKIAIFENTATINSGVISAPDLYRLGTVIASGTTEVEEVQQNEILYINKSPLTKPTISRPVYVRTGPSSITTYPTNSLSTTCTYTKTPTKPNWGYIVLDGTAMYDTMAAVNFELHKSEESELVYKILKYAGVTLKNPEVVQIGSALEQSQVQQEKQ